MNDRPVAVVLGAGMGGRAVALSLAQRAHVVVVDRALDLAQAAVDPITAAGGSAEALVVDLTDLSAVAAFRDDLLERHGRVDAVIHLVGGWHGADTVDAQSIEQWNELFPGIVGTVQTTSVAFRETLATAPHGRYVMVTSTAVRKPSAKNAAYASTKSAAESWVRSLGAAFDGTDARAFIVAVMALVDQATRDANPDRAFKGYTDTTALATAIAGLLHDDSRGSDTYLDLTA